MKQIFTILGLLTLSTQVFAQADTDIVNIPDPNFKARLLDADYHTIDTNGDAEISYGEARAYKDGIYAEDANIKDLAGIEAFVDIVSLACYNNQLERLDLSKNTKLESVECYNNLLKHLDISGATSITRLECQDNQLTSLDLSKNTKLEELSCSRNQLASLDLSKNIALTTLSCTANQLTNLDLSKNTGLSSVYCFGNQLTSLDLSKNGALTAVDCSDNKLTQLNLANGNNAYMSSVIAFENPSLTCIQVDAGFTPPADWQKDATASWNENCNYPNLSTQENKAVDFLQILNPVKDNLVFNTTTKIEKVELYNAVGQLVKVLQNGTTQVQDLAKGIYIAKITTEKGVITKKVVKD